MFVKERFGAVKAAAAPGTPHGDLMRTLSQHWQLSKNLAHETSAACSDQAGPRNVSLEAAFAEIRL